MLIGGDGAGAQYQEQDWMQLAKQMNLLARQHRIKWLLSTSRRTGKQAEKILQQYLNFECIVDVVWWAEQPRAVLHQFWQFRHAHFVVQILCLCSWKVFLPCVL